MESILEMEKSGQSPLLLGYLTHDRRQVKVWCPFCRRWHYHGADEDMLNHRGSHRVGHCHHFEFGFRGTGYYIRLINKKDKKDMLS